MKEYYCLKCKKMTWHELTYLSTSDIHGIPKRLQLVHFSLKCYACKTEQTSHMPEESWNKAS